MLNVNICADITVAEGKGQIFQVANPWVAKQITGNIYFFLAEGGPNMYGGYLKILFTHQLGLSM